MKFIVYLKIFLFKILNLSNLNSFEDKDLKDEVEDYGYKKIESLDAFKNMLQVLKRKKNLASKIGALDYLIDNEMNYDLELMKGAFEALILNPDKILIIYNKMKSYTARLYFNSFSIR